jgi:hypothetical protein
MDTANNGSSDDESEAEPMDVEDDAVYAKRHDDDMEASGPDKGEPEKMANADWGQLGETTKSKENRENFVRDTAETKKYEKAKRSDFVRECRTGVQQRKREWKKAKQKRENRKMPQTPPPREQEEGVPRSRLTQVWWLENEILAGGAPSPPESTRRAG